MGESDELAKSIQALSKLGSDAIANISDLERLGGKLLGPFGQGYGILTDIVRHGRDEIQWRLENRRRVYLSAARKAQNIGVDLRNLTPVPLRIAYDYESGIEREDDPSLQDLWSNLLVNLCNPNSGIAPQKIYGDVLARLDPDAAQILNEFGLRNDKIRLYFIVAAGADGGCQINPIKRDSRTQSLVSTSLLKYHPVDGSFFCAYSDDKVDAIVDTLQSLGLVQRGKELHLADELFAEGQIITPSTNFVELGKAILENADGVDAFGMSRLGEDFYAAVSPPVRR